jgi:uncharacterized protein DUF2800
MAAHAFLAPSSAHRMRLCAGSAWMESQFPDLGDDTASREGEACHWVMQHRFTGMELPVGSMAPNGVEVTQAMHDAVGLLEQDIVAQLGPDWRRLIAVERPVAIPRVHPTLCWGTPDVRAWAQKDGVSFLFVWDLKYGFKRVEAFENDQLVEYAAGCLSEAQVLGDADQRVRCVLTVVQPRAYHTLGPVRSWEVMACDLRAQINILAMAADEATGTAPKCRPQPEACENCRARSGCGALQEAVYRGMDIARQATPREMPDDAMGLELAYLDDVESLIKARKSGLEEVVKARLAKGARISHWRMGPGQGKTVWTKSPAEVALLGEFLQLDLKQPLDVCTPLQAKAKGLPEGLMKQYSNTVSGATKLLREDGANVRRIFSRI